MDCVIRSALGRRISFHGLVVALPLAFAGMAACAPTPAPSASASPMAGKRTEGTRGMVAASQPDAAAAGVAVLRLGGNAADAAVAAAFALSVTDISQTGLGGGGALTFYDARARRAEHLSFYPRTGADPAWGERDTTRTGTRAPGRAAGVPGMVAGLLETQRRFGRLSLAQVMAPAIALARDGFIVTPLLSRTITSARERLAADSQATARFLPGGEALRPGDRLVQPELAATLERIAAGGAAAFYTGPVAERLAAKVQSQGGLIRVSDMADYPVATTRPLCTEWLGYTVLSAPPPLGGASVLAMLEMAEASGLTSAAGFTDAPAAVTTMTDILRYVHADGSWWRGDPAANDVPARGFVSGAYAAERVKLLTAAVPDSTPRGDPWPFDAEAPSGTCAADPYPAATRRAATDPTDAHEQRDENTSFTSHLAVVDGDGNAVSATTTVGVLFGSGVYTDGFFLNSSGSNFDDRNVGPNRYANSTMAPTLILERGEVRLVIGAAGSQYIQPAIAQLTLRILAFGEDAGTAIAAPRIYASATRRDVEVEPGFTSPVYAALVARGYRPLSRVADITFGGVHGIHVRRDGRRIGIADPRRDGAALRQ